jgi:hypothetical protein
MTMRLVTLLLVCALAVPVAAGAQTEPNRGAPDPRITDGTRQDQLDAARKRWKTAHVRSYRYQISVSCFCAPSKGLVYVVRNGVPKVPAKGQKSIATVPRLFKTIQGAIDRKVANLDVTYGRRGVPKSIYIDSSQMIADEEVGYTITHFTTLK